jgi:hypothetical protein
VKRRIAIGLLFWTAAWPLGHRALVAAYDVNPWKLGGFAMYTTATPPIQVVAFEKVGSHIEPLDESQLSHDAQRVLRRFRIERHALGKLRGADDLGDALLRARPDLAWIAVAVQKMTLDAGSARMTSSRQQYVFERAD